MPILFLSLLLFGQVDCPLLFKRLSTKGARPASEIRLLSSKVERRSSPVGESSEQRLKRAQEIFDEFQEPTLSSEQRKRILEVHNLPLPPKGPRRFAAIKKKFVELTKSEKNGAPLGLLSNWKLAQSFRPLRRIPGLE